jgi:hypothetical protein
MTLCQQYFCGYSNYMPGMPCNATELVHFRKRIGVKGFNLIEGEVTIVRMVDEDEPTYEIDYKCKNCDNKNEIKTREYDIVDNICVPVSSQDLNFPHHSIVSWYFLCSIV